MLQRSTRGRFAAVDARSVRSVDARSVRQRSMSAGRDEESPSSAGPRAFGTRADASSSQHTASRALSRHGDAGPWFERRLVAASAPANGLLFTDRLLSDRQPGSQKLASRPARTPRLASRTARVRGGPKVLKTQREPHRPAQRTAAALGSTDATLGSTDARQHPSTAPRPRMLLNEPLAMDDMAMDDGMSMGDDGSPAFCSGMAATRAETSGRVVAFSAKIERSARGDAASQEKPRRAAMLRRGQRAAARGGTAAAPRRRRGSSADGSREGSTLRGANLEHNRP